MARRTLHPALLMVAGAVLVACLLVALLALSERKAEAAFPGKSGMIAFSGQPEGGGRDDVFIINPDGSGLRNLTNPSGRTETEPSFSADGEKIVYVRKPSDSQNREIVTVNFPGGSQRTTVARSYAYFPEPAFSPNGQRIAFARYEEGFGGYNIWEARAADGSNQVPVTDDTPENPSAPSWGPLP